MVKATTAQKFGIAFRCLLVLIPQLMTTAARANEPTVDDWVKEYEGRDRSKQEFRYPERLLIVKDVRSELGPTFAKIAPQSFNWLGMFEIQDFRQLRFQFRLNQKPHNPPLRFKSEEANIFKAAAPELFRRFNSDLILFTPPMGTWEVYDPFHEDPVIRDQNPPKDKLSSAVINNWINRHLGYDGYIVAQKGRYVLIKSQAAFMRQGLQALLLKGSDEDFILEEKKSKGGALLQAIASKGQYGLYKVIVAQDDTHNIVPGTKVVLERPK